MQVELCRFGDGATPLSDFSVPAWNGGAALARDMSLSLGSAVTYCLLLLRRCLRGGRFDCFRLLRFCSLPSRVFSLLESGFASAGSFCILKKGHISCACRALFSRSRSAETDVFPGRVQGGRHML